MNKKDNKLSMKATLSIAQFNTITKDPEANLAKAEIFIIEAKRRGSDIIVFPEMWTTGFQWNWIDKELAHHNLINKQVSLLASKHNISILGSTLHVDINGSKTNRAVLYDTNGLINATYDKAHLFFGAEENKHLKAGTKLTTFSHGFGKSGFSICYDIRFPELFRSYALQDVKIIFLMAAFPFPRHQIWNTLCRARAIENQLFMVCVNRVGKEQIPDIGEFHYCGNSAIINPYGEIVIQAGGEEEILLTAEIDISSVDHVRQLFPVLQDRNPSIYFKG